MKAKDLPKHWELKPLEEICEVIPGNSPPSSTYNEDGVGLPFFQGSGEFGEKFPQHDRWCSDPKKIALPDDILVSVRAPVGDTNICHGESCIGRGLAALRPNRGIEPLFLFYGIRAFQNELILKGSGSTFDSISSGELREFEIPITRTDEQKRIVAKIEELFSKVDSGAESLNTTEKRLDLYQSSVIKSAITGKLTETWRSENQQSASGADLVERAQEKEEKNKYKKQGKLNGNSEEQVFEVPSSWGWAQVGDICKAIRYGSSEKADYEFEGVPLLRMGNIENGKLNYDDLKYLPTDWEREELILTSGDVLFNRTNSAELVGKTALYKENHPRSTFASYLVRAQVYPDIYNPALLVYFTNSVFGRQYINSVISQQVGQANVNATKFASMPIPVPSIEEQNEIVREVDHRLSIVDEVMNEVDSNLKRSSRLRQSILKNAFEGNLVPKDPTEDPPAPYSGETNLEQGAQATLWEVTSDVE